jgi:hypothetical protein
MSTAADLLAPPGGESPLPALPSLRLNLFLGAAAVAKRGSTSTGMQTAIDKRASRIRLPGGSSPEYAWGAARAFGARPPCRLRAIEKQPDVTSSLHSDFR